MGVTEISSRKAGKEKYKPKSQSCSTAQLNRPKSKPKPISGIPPGKRVRSAQSFTIFRLHPPRFFQVALADRRRRLIADRSLFHESAGSGRAGLWVILGEHHARNTLRPRFPSPSWALVGFLRDAP